MMLVTRGAGNQETHESWERRRLAQLTAKYTPLAAGAPLMMYCVECGHPSLFTPKADESVAPKTMHQLLRREATTGPTTPDAFTPQFVEFEFAGGRGTMAEFVAEHEQLLEAIAVREADEREELAELTEKYGVPVAEPWPRAAEDCDRCKEMWG